MSEFILGKLSICFKFGSVLVSSAPSLPISNFAITALSGLSEYNANLSSKSACSDTVSSFKYILLPDPLTILFTFAKTPLIVSITDSPSGECKLATKVP